ncbi:hypothetical protein [Microbacterium sp.]|uniref:hypothetical protein n=1 Tax=Microbacterium sp. TaxID=51671 RepID=UPI00281195CA|nr:hypothetical protein [Microbacterium sp.]
MDPILAVATELWWIAPAAGGAGAIGFGLRRRRDAVSGRRLGYDAARLELRQAQADARAAADAVRFARAELARVVADHAASRTDAGHVAAARRALRDAQLAAKAAHARVRACRARLVAERRALTGHGETPLERVRGRHDAVLARWMEYETDPAKILAFPAMSDGRQPATASFLSALQRARDLRPGGQGRPTPADFAAYRDAVEELERAFDAAERTARGDALPPDLPVMLRDAARTIVVRSTEVISRTGGVIGAWNARRRGD